MDLRTFTEPGKTTESGLGHYWASVGLVCMTIGGFIYSNFVYCLTLSVLDTPFKNECFDK